jgi:hypothetical protein
MTLFRTKLITMYQSLVSLVVIDIRFNKDNYNSIPTYMIERWLESLDDRNNSQTRLDGPVNRIPMMKTKKRKK